MLKTNIFISLLKNNTNIDVELIKTFFKKFKIGEELNFDIIDKDVALLVVSDVSPNRYAFWIAFESCRKKIIWLQHSFDLRPVPGVMFKVDYALLKSNAGMDFITKNLESGF